MRVLFGRSTHASLAIAMTLASCYASHGRDDAGAVLRVDAAERDSEAADSPLPDAVIDLPDSPGTSDVCARDSDCTGGLCVLDVRAPAIDRAAVSLVCGRAGAVPPGSECEANGDCENGLCALAGGCVEPCLGDSDCRMDERCTTVPIITGPSAMQEAMACARWVDAPSSVTVAENRIVSVVPFGSQALSVPPSSASHRLVLHLADRYADFRTIDRVALASGTSLYESLSFERQINPATAFFDVAPILIPNAPWPAALDPRGGLDYAITSGGESELRRIVLEHEGVGTAIDLNVFFVGVVRDSRTRRTVTNMLSSYEVILDSLGLRLGRVRERNAVGSAAAGFAILEDYPEAGELFRLSVGGARPAVNLFLVSTSPVFLGIAGGIPGAQTVHGTRASGIALSVDDLSAALEAGYPIEFLAVVLAHELGHFSGLFHSTEMDGSTYEPLIDTAECGLSRDLNSDGMLTADECLGADGANIMFWGVTYPDSTFSPSQRDVLRAAPVLLP